MGSLEIQQGNTLWGIAKQSVQAQNPEGQKVTNQQIVDEMNKIAHENGYESIDDCVNDNFYQKDGKFGSLNVKGLGVEHTDEYVAEDVVEEDAVDQNPDEAVEDMPEQALRYTTLGAGGTFAAKTALKLGREVVKNPKLRRSARKLKGKANAAKVRRARNGQAAKIRNARKAADAVKAAKDTLKAEQAKLKSLKANKASKAAIAAQEAVVKKAKAKSAEAAKQLRAKRKAAGLNQRTGQPLRKTRNLVKTAGRKAARTGAKKAAAKAAAKAGGKTILKKIPVVGLLAGIAFGVDRAIHGDWGGAVGEVASGAVACVPGVGTAASLAIDGGLMYRDIKNAK